MASGVKIGGSNMESQIVTADETQLKICLMCKRPITETDSCYQQHDQEIEKTFCTFACFENSQSLLLRDSPTSSARNIVNMSLENIQKPVQVTDKTLVNVRSKVVVNGCLALMEQFDDTLAILKQQIAEAKLKIEAMERVRKAEIESNNDIHQGQADRLTELYDTVKDIIVLEQQSKNSEEISQLKMRIDTLESDKRAQEGINANLQSRNEELETKCKELENNLQIQHDAEKSRTDKPDELVHSLMEKMGAMEKTVTEMKSRLEVSKDLRGHNYNPVINIPVYNNMGQMGQAEPTLGMGVPRGVPSYRADDQTDNPRPNYTSYDSPGPVDGRGADSGFNSGDRHVTSTHHGDVRSEGFGSDTERSQRMFTTCQIM
ncbi:uncharacterized protein LOC144438483 [Glandiceps talaboti]